MKVSADAASVRNTAPNSVNTFGNASSQASANSNSFGGGASGQNSVQQLLSQIINQLSEVFGLVANGFDAPGGQNQTDEFRSIDGTGNNLSNPELGSANTPFSRISPADYDENGWAGSDRPNARDVSNAVSAQTETSQNEAGASDLFWQWGQFLDHDITATESEHSKGETTSISIPTGDKWFDPQGTGNAEIPFTRSPTTDGSGSGGEQFNHITSFIDGSMVYGSDEETASNLRSFEGGRLKMDENGLLPTDEEGNFLAGDERVNEQTGLTSMHTLWVREHNRIADEISAENPSLSDEEIYQEARQLVGAQIQHITYNEFLPELVGEDALGEYQGYDPNVDPSLTNEFSTAAFRFGHTMLSPEIPRIDENGNEIPEGNLSLSDAFFQPDRLREAGIDPVIRGQAQQVAQSLDPMIIDDVRNTLFGPPGSGGLDLAALNIQRGRDHGLPSWNDTRQAMGLERINSFDDPIFQDDFGQRLASVYDSPDDVDLWVGGLAEQTEDGAMVGETFKGILVDQFDRLRSGDRFWYENTLDQDQLNEVKRTSLADVIERNTDVEMNDDTAMIATDNTQNIDDNNLQIADSVRELSNLLQQIAENLSGNNNNNRW